MGVIWLMTNAMISYCVAQVGRSCGAASYDVLKHIANYVWLKPEEGYFLDYPDDPEKETNLRTVRKRLKRMMQK